MVSILSDIALFVGIVAGVVAILFSVVQFIRWKKEDDLGD